jgi:hypothetical protein
VVAYEHVYTAPGKARTTITTRGRVAGAHATWLQKGDVGLQDNETPLELVNFRLGAGDPTTHAQAYDWDASPVHTVDVYRTEDSETAPTAPWPDLTTATPTETLPASAVENLPYSYSVARATASGMTAYVEFVPRDPAGLPGKIERIRLDPLPDVVANAPTLDVSAFVVDPTTGLFGDVSVQVDDPQFLGGRLYAYVNHDFPVDPTPTAAADGYFDLVSTPQLIGPSHAFHVGAGTSLLLHGVVVHASRGKRIAFEFVNSAGLTTGKRWFVLTGGGGVIDANGNLKPGSVLNALNFAAGIMPVEVYPDLTTARPDGTIMFNTGDGKLYKRVAGVWVNVVNAPDLTGILTSAQIADAAITTAKLATSISLVDIVSTLPTTGLTQGRIVFLTTDNKIYRYNGSTWTTSQSAADIAGQISAAQIASGAVTQTQLASNLKMVQVVSSLPTSGQVVGDVVYLTGDTKLYRWNGSAWTAAVSALDIAGQITAAQIASGTITPTLLASSIKMVQVVSTLPTSGQLVGDVVYLTTDTKLYRWNGSAWTSAVSAADIAGQIQSGQIATGAVTATALASSISVIDVVSVLPSSGMVQGKLVFLTTDNKIYRYTGSAWITTQAAVDVSGQIAASQIAAGAVTQTQLASNLKTVQVLAALPSSGMVVGDVVFLTTDNKLYRYTGSAWTTAQSAADISGQISAAQIAAGAITTTQLASSIRAVQVVGVLPGAGTAGDVVFLTTDNKLYRYTGSAWTAAVDTSNLTGTVSAAQIAAGAITAGKIAADAVTAGTIAAAAITARELAVGAVTAGKIAAGAVTAGSLSVLGSTGAALNSDPQCADVTAWGTGAGHGTVSVVTGLTDGVVGTTSLRSGTGDTWIFNSAIVAVDVTKTYRVHAWVRRNAAANGQVYVMVNGLDATGASVQGPAGTFWYTGPIGAPPPANTWTLYEGLLGAGTPQNDFTGSGVKAMQLGALANYTGTAGYYEFQDFRLEEVVPATLIRDGAITTAKIVADAVTATQLAANSVTAGDLQANAVTAGTIAAAAITARELAVGSVTATQVAAGAISVAKLTVTDFSNLAENPNFELGAVGWNSDFGRWTVVASPPNGYAGDNVMRYTAWASGSDNLRSVNYITCAPGDWFMAECYIRRVGAVTTGAQVYIAWYNQALAQLSYTLGNIITNANADSTWFRSFVRAQAPAGATRCAVTVIASSTTNFIDVDAVLLRRMGTGELIVDGTITALALAANSVTALQIAANSIVAGDLQADAVTAGTVSAAAITARELAVDSVTAAKIAAGAVSASKLTISDFTNLAENPSFELNGGSLSGWAADSGSFTVVLANTAQSGNVHARKVGVAGGPERRSAQRGACKLLARRLVHGRVLRASCCAS